MSNTENQNPNPQPQQGPMYFDPKEGIWKNGTPPKKTHKFRNFVVFPIVGFVGLLIVIGSLSSGSGSTDTPAQDAVKNETTASAPVTTSAKPSVPKSQKPVEQAPKIDCVDQDNRNEPCTIHLGKTFVSGSHTIASGWKVRQDVLGSLEIVGKAKNTGDAASTMFATVKFLKGDDVVMTADCTTDELEPNQTQALSCFSTTKFSKKYDRITVEAQF